MSRSVDRHSRNELEKCTTKNHNTAPADHPNHRKILLPLLAFEFRRISVIHSPKTTVVEAKHSV